MENLDGVIPGNLDGVIASPSRFLLANDKAQDVTIKKLTHGNPTMKAKFEALA
jgi:hypothetical protein